jgi:hypothetical protein
MHRLQWNHKIFNSGKAEFEALALEVFRYQSGKNPVYRAYIEALGWDPQTIQRLEEIPFLPIRFFRSHKVLVEDMVPQAIFESSGTTGSEPSRHYVADPGLYKEGFLKTFRQFYGDPGGWCILGLLPSYLERSNSSLVYMVRELCSQSGHQDSGFYLDEFDRLASLLKDRERGSLPTLLIGVSFALLDFSEKYPMPLKHTVVMETGGMKGRREELVREELHRRLAAAWTLKEVHSEYGMTELMSQAYARKNGRFESPPWLKIGLRDDEDPFSLSFGCSQSRSGAINVIDLANIYSCSFIATDDVGRLHADGTFEVLGRLDGSDLRGCSLLTA